MAGTIMGTFKAQLLTKLQANDTLSDIQVTYQVRKTAKPGRSSSRLLSKTSSSMTHSSGTLQVFSGVQWHR